MYRRLVLKSNPLGITTKCSNWNLLVVRSLSGKDDKKGDGDKDASNKVANVNKKREPFRLENASKKLETLAANAKDFKSISAKDDKSVSKVMGKPKYFVRVSARSEEDKRKAMPVETIEPLSKMASGLDKRLVEAAKRVAKKIPNRIKSKLTEKELIDSLNEQKIETEKAKQQLQKQILKEDYRQSISYKIMAENRKERDSLLEPVVEKITMRPRTRRTPPQVIPSMVENITRRTEKILFAGERLNIFDPKGKYTAGEESPLWEKLAREQLELSVHCAPENGFEEMIKLTEEGKLWHFPIDNEQGLEQEAQVPFYEHVLLDHLLETFPTQGPVRQFMELIIMGLSKNPYISVERKHQTVEYYRQYFEDKNLMMNFEITEDAGEKEATIAASN